MNEIDWSTVDLNILLNCSLLCNFSVASESSIEKSKAESHTVEREELYNRPVNVKHHSTD